MKEIKDAIINLGILLVILYLPFAFIANEFNPTSWSIYIRALYVLVLATAITYAVREYQQKK